MATAKLYGNAAKLAFQKTIDLVNDNIKVMLVTSSYSPDQDAHIYKDTATGLATNEIVSTGYTAGGNLLQTKTWNYDSASNTVTFDAQDMLSASGNGWASIASATFQYAVIYDDTPASSKPLLAYVDFGAQTVTNGKVEITWNASGIFSFTAS